MLTEHNAVRLRSGLKNLSLAASVVFLNEKFSSEKTDQLISQEIKRHSSINKVDHYPVDRYQAPEAQETECDWEENDQYVLMTRSGGRGAINRGRGRGNFNRDDFGRQGYPKISNNQGAPAIPQNLRGAPPPPDWRRGRGRAAAPAGAARGRGTGRPTAQPRLNNQNDQGTPKITYFKPTASMFGVAPRTCYSCGDPSHRLHDEACFYKETTLQQQSCPACHIGGHLRSQCCGPNTAVQLAFNPFSQFIPQLELYSQLQLSLWSDPITLSVPKSTW